MTEEKILEVRRTQQAMNWQSRQTGRVDKVGVFVGNLPYTFDEVRGLSSIHPYRYRIVPCVQSHRLDYLSL